MLLLNSPSPSTNIVNTKYSCFSDSGMSTMGWQSQHQHASQCNPHQVSTVQQSPNGQSMGQYGGGGCVGGANGSWGLKGGVTQNGSMMNANYSVHNGQPMNNYGPNDMYNTGCTSVPMQKMYNSAPPPPPPTNQTTMPKTQSAGYVIHSFIHFLF